MRGSNRSGPTVGGKRKLPPRNVPVERQPQPQPGHFKKRRTTAQQRPAVTKSLLAEKRAGPLPAAEERGSLEKARLPRRQKQAFVTNLLKDDKPGIDAALFRALNVSNESELKDLMNCLILAEGTYKIVDLGKKAAARMVERITSLFPPGLATIERVQWSLQSVHHRYLLADDKDTLYVSFMGTKQRRDLVTNAAVLQEPLWPNASTEAERKVGAVPAAHRGFLSRAKAVPIEGLYAHACRQGKRLVLTGHSLGGAVAALSVLRLLEQLPAGSTPAIRCITFACPAIGNQPLADCVRSRRWEPIFQNLLVPEDVVPRLLAAPEQTPQQVADAAIAALQPIEAAAIGDEFVEATLDLFDDVFDAVTNDDPLGVPVFGPAAYDDLLRTRSTSLNPPFQSDLQPPAGRSRVSNLGPKPSSPARPIFQPRMSPALINKWQSEIVLQQPRSSRSEKELAIEGASVFESLAKEDEEEVLRSLDIEDASWSAEEGGENENNLELEEEEKAELAEIRGEQSALEAIGEADSATAGGSWKRLGRERLTASQEVFFPWSASPLPSFARQMAGRALKSAKGNLGRLKGRKLPFLKDVDARSQTPDAGSPSPSQPGFLGRLSLPGRPQFLEGGSPSTSDIDRLAAERDRLSAAEEGVSTAAPQPERPDVGWLSLERDPQKAVRGEGGGSPRRRPLNRPTIGRLGENVGRAASGAARGAARFVTVPLRVAQRNYAVLGKQAFLAIAGVLPASEGDAEQSFQKGLEGATASSRASALAFPKQGASPSTIVSLQLPIAAARRRQPFLMHKMAFHRARILSIVERTMSEKGVQPFRVPLSSIPSMLSQAVAPDMKPDRAEVFLPYSLPDGKDLRTMLDDLESISALPPVTALIKQNSESKRFQWLLPWRWISGFGWGGADRRGIVELTAQVRGKGLEHCTSVQVHETQSGVRCRTEIMYRPQQPVPAEMYGQLGLHRKGFQRGTARFAFWAKDVARDLSALLDRTNALGSSDCLLVKMYLPLDVMKSMEVRLLQQAGEDSGLVLSLKSDFRKIQMPLQVHGGSSWLVSDLRSSSRSLNDWINQNITG